MYLRPGANGWEVLGATSSRFPNDAKFPGGTNKKCPWETVEQTLVREFGEETGSLTPVEFRLLLDVDDRYLQYFFVITRVEGSFEKVRIFNETDGDVVVIRWWGLEEFYQQVFKNHEPAFLKLCRALAPRVPGFLKNAPSLERALRQMG